MDFLNPILDTIARSHRNARGIGAAVALLVAILAMLSLRCDPVTERGPVLGLVVEIEAAGLRDPATGESRTRVIAVTPDSTEIRLLLPPPVPKPGDFVPLRREQHRKGGVEYRIDIQRWRTEGAL